MAGTAYIIRTNYTAQKKKAAEEQQMADNGDNIYSTIHNSGNVFGTTYNITYHSENDLHESIKAELAKVDNSLSPFNDRSIISAINNNVACKPDSMFIDVFTLAQEISQRTDGAFDITVAPLVNAWGFGFRNGAQVSSQAIDSLMQSVGYSKVALNGEEITKQHPETMLDCSAIAKGYGCDAVARLLDKNGITDYMVEIGGEVVTKGKNPNGKKWAIGITKPTDDPEANSQELYDVIYITDKSMATSGNYRRFRIENGKKYAHTIDPRTGYPVEHTLLSATVIADNCSTADAYATAFMVMGKEKAMEICLDGNGIDAYLIYADDNGNMKTEMTEGFKRYLTE